jgi:DNA-binding protein YbaB
MQKALAAEAIEINENGVKLIITGDMKVREMTIDGAANQRVLDAVNKGLKKAQEMAAKKMQEMSGGLGGMMKMMGQ